MGKERIVCFGERPFGATVVLLDGRSDLGSISMQKDIAGERHKERKTPRKHKAIASVYGMRSGR